MLYFMYNLYLNIYHIDNLNEIMYVGARPISVVIPNIEFALLSLKNHNFNLHKTKLWLPHTMSYCRPRG